MGSLYTVKYGDTLVGIAQANGYDSWREIYYHDDNWEFRQKRPDPDKIYPGDVLVLPDRAPPPPEKKSDIPEDAVIARDGDSLCSLAHERGFKNCEKLRAMNLEFNNRHVEDGDFVLIPGRDPKQEDGATEEKHVFETQVRRVSVHFITDRDRDTPEAALGSDGQARLAVSNFVPTRQGAGFTNGDWKDHTFFGYDADASADPDHFKVQVFDFEAEKAGETEVKVTLQVQKPKLSVHGRIEAWEDMTEAGTKLENVVCKQVVTGEAWYRSHYLRLVADTQDQTAKRPHGRSSDGGTDVSKQTLVVPALNDSKMEILDYRVVAYRPMKDCAAASDAGRCLARRVAGVGKDEKSLVMKVTRIGGASGSGISDADIESMVFVNMRATLAQSDVGIYLVGNQAFDAPEPRNMIVVSDYDAKKADGGGEIRIRVRMPATSSVVEVNVRTGRKAKPEETARKIAKALEAKGVKCTVSPNPPVQDAGDDFGSCDILCRDEDLNPVRILSATSSDSDQKVAHTGGFNSASVEDTTSQYGSTNGTNAQMVGSIDFRAACKNYTSGTNRLDVILVNDFARGGLLGKALLPYRDVVSRLRPLPECSMCVFLDHGGATRRTVLAHEAGHVLLDAFHTTRMTGGVEKDWDNNAYDNNTKLAFSEWMSAISRESSGTFIHKRMSDDPSTVKYAVVKKGVNNLQGEIKTLGGAEPSPVQRFRTLSSSVLKELRKLENEPGFGG